MIAYMSSLNTPKKPARKDWHKADIKAALEKAGWTFRALAKAHDKCHSYFSETLIRPNPKAQAVIAQTLKTKPEQLWPSRYDASGLPLRGLYTGSRTNGRDYLSRSVGKARASGNGNVRVVA